MNIFEYLKLSLLDIINIHGVNMKSINKNLNNSIGLCKNKVTYSEFSFAINWPIEFLSLFIYLIKIKI